MGRRDGRITCRWAFPYSFQLIPLLQFPTNSPFFIHHTIHNKLIQAITCNLLAMSTRCHLSNNFPTQSILCIKNMIAVNKKNKNKKHLFFYFKFVLMQQRLFCFVLHCILLKLGGGQKLTCCMDFYSVQCCIINVHCRTSCVLKT